MQMLWTRRMVLQAGVVFVLTGCKRRYERPYGELYLGPVSSLLYTQQFVRDRAILVFRDDEGWSSLSTRCSHEGCELSYQDEQLVCMCCGSYFSINGRVKKGPATEALPWFEMRYGDGGLYAISGKPVDAKYRFTTPELSQALNRLMDRIEKDGGRIGGRIPQELLGEKDPEFGGRIFQPEAKRDQTTSTTVKDSEGSAPAELTERPE